MIWLLRAWDARTDAERAQWTGVALCLALFGVHFTIWSPWLIEDAAISYSYARNAALGDGWVTYPGGEWVEGFSNPTWTALLAFLQIFGLSPWIVSPWLGLLFGALTLPLSFLWAREVTDDDGLMPVIAPLFLAVSPQFVVWTGSGLENALWCWLLTLGAWVFLRELRQGGPPWSALPMALLAITRPEGPLYVATLAFAGAALGLRRHPRHLARIAAWVAICASVWFAWEAYRWTVFAWPLPNTYYAKLEIGFNHFQPFNWGPDGRLGWTYLRGWALWTAMGFTLPLFPLAATGLEGWRGQVGRAVAVVLALLLIPGAHWLTSSGFWPLAAEPDAVVRLRVGLILFAVFALPWLGLGRRGDEARIVAWTLLGTLFAFVLYAGADWMEGYRWVNHAVVPLAVLLADVVATVARMIPWAGARARRTAFAAVAGLPLAASVVHTGFLLAPTETTPFDVGRRVFFFTKVQERLHIDHITLFDIDMGAIMWWSGDRILDVGGLVDIPIGHHEYENPFIREYVLTEERPEFIHSHANWMARAGLQFQPVFKREWIRIEDFVAGPAYMHIGNYIRRDLIFRPTWDGPRDRVQFGEQLVLEGLATPAPTVLPGGILYVEVGWRAKVDGPGPFRPVLALAREGVLHTWDLPPAYDWVAPGAWKRREVVHGFHSLTLPADLEPGTYDLALVVYDRAGVWPAAGAAEPSVLARGEKRWAGRVTVAEERTVLASVESGLGSMQALAAGGLCEDAETAMNNARRHLPEDHTAQPWRAQANHAELARCWARRAPTLADEAAERAIRRARDWDHRDAEVRAIAKGLADRWEAEGDALWAEDRASPAYLAWRRTLAADPARPWVRKRAEEARSVRLGLGDEAETAAR